MTIQATNVPAYAAADRFSFGRLFRSVARKMQASRAINELNRLSDRELADLGLCRADIPGRVAEVLGMDRA